VEAIPGRGPDEQITAFVAGHGSRMLGSITLVASNRQEAEDALAEAVGRAWDHLRRGRSIDSLEAWIFVVASNELRRSARRRLGRPAPPPTATSMEDTPDLGPAALGAAVRALPTRQRQVIVLRYWFDLPLADIAAALSVAEGTVKAHLHQARSALRTQLAASEGAVL